MKSNCDNCEKEIQRWMNMFDSIAKELKQAKEKNLEYQKEIEMLKQKVKEEFDKGTKWLNIQKDLLTKKSNQEIFEEDYNEEDYE